ncbi:hypothetical protein Tco_0409026 [Tanacetum coccineum]
MDKKMTDHPSLASSTRGKTLAGLEQIMPAGLSFLLGQEQEPQIRTTMGSSITLSCWLVTATATTTSQGKARRGYPSEAKRVGMFLGWNYLLNGALFKTMAFPAILVDELLPPLLSALVSMECDQIISEFNVGRHGKIIALGRRKTWSSSVEILSWRKKWRLKTTEVSSLRAGFKDFKEKMEIQQEEQAQELYNRVAELEAHVMDVSGRLEGEFYPTYLTLLAGRRWLLTHGIQLALLKCLKSSEYQGILGHALGRAVDFGMQEGLEAGHEHGVAGRSLSVVDAYNPEVASADYVNAVKALEDAHFPLVDLLKSKKDAGMDEVLDCFLLDGPLAELPEAASLQPCIEQLSIPIHHAGDKTAIGETSLSFALMNVHARAKGAKKHAVALRQLMMEIVSAPLSSQTWVGEASISAAPLSVEDYAEEDTDEALGSVVAAPHLERCCL